MTRRLLSTSINFPWGQETFRQFPSTLHNDRRASSTFLVAGGPCITFHQLSVLPGNLSTTSVNFLCGRKTIRQLPWTFCAAGRHSVNFRQLFVRPADLLSTSVNFRQLFVRPADLLSTSVDFRQLSVRSGNLLSSFSAAGRSSVNFLCCQEIFRQLSLHFRTARSSSVNFCQHFVLPGELPSTSFNSYEWPEFLPSTSCACGRPSVNLCLLTVRPVDLLSTFCTSGKPSVNFRQLSVPLSDLPSIFIIFLCGPKTFLQLLCSRENLRHLPSTFRTAERLSVNFPLISMPPGDLPSTSVNFPCSRQIFRHLSMQSAGRSSVIFLEILSNSNADWRPSAKFCQLSQGPRDLPSASVNFPCGQLTFC